MNSVLEQLSVQNQHTWLRLGRMHEASGSAAAAQCAYESGLRFNAYSSVLLRASASCSRSLERYPAAIELYRRLLRLHSNDGSVWTALAHCHLLANDNDRAYEAYQKALLLDAADDPWLWYGVAILYARSGSHEYAEAAFLALLAMAPSFCRAPDVYLRLAAIYTLELSYQNALGCLVHLLDSPPPPLAVHDVLLLTARLHEQHRHHHRACTVYEHILQLVPTHTTALQQLGWIHSHRDTALYDHPKALAYLEQSFGTVRTDAFTWYLMGRVHMDHNSFSEAYECYQKAVYPPANTVPLMAKMQPTGAQSACSTTQSANTRMHSTLTPGLSSSTLPSARCGTLPLTKVQSSNAVRDLPKPDPGCH